MKNIHEKIRHLAKHLAASLPVPGVYADSVPFRAVGVDLTPLEDEVPDIVMREERVDIHLYPEIAVVEATFWLHNEGERTGILVGFPCFGKQTFTEPHDGGLLDFAAFVEGKPVEILSRKLENEYYPAWYVWTQVFPEHAVSCLKVRYYTVLFDYAHVSRIPFTYVLRTGRFWKGRIGKACITVHAKGIPFTAIQEATPSGFVMNFQQKTLSWLFEDFDPKNDIGLLLSPTIIQGHTLGIVVDDVLDVNESHPSAGTEITVGGHVRGQDDRGVNLHELRESSHDTTSDQLGAYIYSERRQDHNITIPDRISIFDSNDPRLALYVAFDADFPIREMDIPVLWRGWTRHLIRGTVMYDTHARLYLHARDVIMLRDTELSDFSSWSLDFPWITGSVFDAYNGAEYEGRDRRIQTQWLTSSFQYERSKVSHKQRWATR